MKLATLRKITENLEKLLESLSPGVHGALLRAIQCPLNRSLFVTVSSLTHKITPTDGSNLNARTSLPTHTTTPPSTRHRTKQEELGQFFYVDAKSQILNGRHVVATLRDSLPVLLGVRCFLCYKGAPRRGAMTIVPNYEGVE